MDAGDAETMAAAVLRLLRDAEFAERLAAVGFVDVQQYTWARVRVRLGELYERVLPAGAASMTTA